MYRCKTILSGMALATATPALAATYLDVPGRAGSATRGEDEASRTIGAVRAGGLARRQEVATLPGGASAVMPESVRWMLTVAVFGLLGAAARPRTRARLP